MNDDDRNLLISLLKFLRHAIDSEQDRNVLEGVIASSLDPVLLFVLEQVASMDISPINHSHQELASEVMSFLRWMLSNAKLSQVEKYAQSSRCAEVLMIYTHHIFASETEMAKKHGNRIDCLMALLPITQIPNIVMLIHSETVVSIISILVQVMGYLQQNYFGNSGSDGFTYKDRRVYRLAVLCLRNLSRSCIDENLKSISWGSHWLFDDDIQWVVVIAE